LPSPAWKEKTKKEKWRLSDTILSSIGQGYLLTSPLQIAQMTARLSTGKEITPTLVKSENAPITADLDIDKNHLKTIQDALFEVVNHPTGTAYFSRLEEFPYSGKTGTSQVKRISLKDRSLGLHKSSNIPFEYKDHAIFTGYGGKNGKNYTVTVLIEHGGSGSKVAAPIAMEIFKKILS
jgi:penicillin-binding protein 2